MGLTGIALQVSPNYCIKVKANFYRVLYEVLSTVLSGGGGVSGVKGIGGGVL